MKRTWNIIDFTFFYFHFQPSQWGAIAGVGFGFIIVLIFSVLSIYVCCTKHSGSSRSSSQPNLDDVDDVISVISNGSSVRSAKIKKIITNEDENRIEIITEEDELASVQDVI